MYWANSAILKSCYIYRLAIEKAALRWSAIIFGKKSLQPLIYPAHTLLGSNVIPYSTGQSISPNSQGHYTTAYDLSPFAAAQLDASAAQYQYAASAVAAANHQPNGASQMTTANSYYAALASQAIAAGAPSLAAAYQQ